MKLKLFSHINLESKWERGALASFLTRPTENTVSLQQRDLPSTVQQISLSIHSPPGDGRGEDAGMFPFLPPHKSLFF